MTHEDLSRPARLPSEAVTLPAMDQGAHAPKRGYSAMSSIRHAWPNAESTQQRPIWQEIEEGEADPIGAPSQRSKVTREYGMTMGRAALRSILNNEEKR